MAAFGGCTTCDGRCCRYYVVMVSGHDIAAIGDAMALRPHQFVVLCRDDELSFEPPGGPGVRLVAGGPTMSMALDEHYDSPARPRCIFLIELPGGQARCAVYSRRPAVCAAYPFAASDGIVFVRDNTLCGSGSWRSVDSELQAKWNNVARPEFEWRLHSLVVTHWNDYVDSRRPRVFSRFELFDYFLDADSRIGQLRSAYSDEECAQLTKAAGAADDSRAVSLWSTFLADVAKALTARTQ